MSKALAILLLALAPLPVAGCGRSAGDEAATPPAVDPAAPALAAPVIPPAPAAMLDPDAPAFDAGDRPADFDAAPSAPATTRPAGGGGRPNRTLHDIQALPRGWSYRQVRRYMKEQVNRGLGTECEACHADEDYAADSELKDVARAMIRMTDELNRRYFGGEPQVSCFTCHRGEREP